LTEAPARLARLGASAVALIKSRVYLSCRVLLRSRFVLYVTLNHELSVTLRFVNEIEGITHVCSTKKVDVSPLFSLEKQWRSIALASFFLWPTPLIH
jgi:hypothetical protein